MASNYLTVDHIPRERLRRLFSKILIDPNLQYNNSPCWLWQGSQMKGKFAGDGYGAVTWNGVNTGVHRVMYAWTIGPIPKGTLRDNGKQPELDHLCRRRNCCNPLHLDLVDRQVNVLRGNGLAAQNARKTQCVHGHEMTDQNVYRNPNNKWECCLICKRIQRKARYEKDKAAKPFFWRRR